MRAPRRHEAAPRLFGRFGALVRAGRPSWASDGLRRRAASGQTACTACHHGGSRRTRSSAARLGANHSTLRTV